MHLDVAFSTLFDLLTTPRLLFLMVVAVPMGIFFGSTPGLGGKLGLVLLIPFVYNMDQLTGAVFLCAMHAVVHTGGSIPEHSDRRAGRWPGGGNRAGRLRHDEKGPGGPGAGREFRRLHRRRTAWARCFSGCRCRFWSRSFFPSAPPNSSCWQFSASPSSRRFPATSFLKGMIVGLFGLMCAFIGLDPSTGSPRFTFGQMWLWDGLSVIVAVLAMFAVPEMISLGVKGRSFDVSPQQAAALKQSGTALCGSAPPPAVRYAPDLPRHPGCLRSTNGWCFRCSLLVAAIGIIPGLGRRCRGLDGLWPHGAIVQTSRDASARAKSQA